MEQRLIPMHFLPFDYQQQKKHYFSLFSSLSSCLLFLFVSLPSSTWKFHAFRFIHSLISFFLRSHKIHRHHQHILDCSVIYFRQEYCNLSQQLFRILFHGEGKGLKRRHCCQLTCLEAKSDFWVWIRTLLLHWNHLKCNWCIPQVKIDKLVRRPVSACEIVNRAAVRGSSYLITWLFKPTPTRTMDKKKPLKRPRE